MLVGQVINLPRVINPRLEFLHFLHRLKSVPPWLPRGTGFSLCSAGY